ncbi:hypothetical protein K7432_016736 [Basidiobolus ranarum]|uniref:Uncharacterized protein n=1 Tax=Basidiobolus ranarum TaxID=34480 RepID=A0ABR2VMA5_9FUNG
MDYVTYAAVLDILLVCRTMDLRIEGDTPNLCKSIDIVPLTECDGASLKANKNKPRPAKKNSWYGYMAKVSMDWLDRFTGGTGTWAHPVVDVAVMPVLLSVGLVRGFNFGIRAGEAWIVGTAVDYYRLLARQPPTEVRKLLRRSLELLTHDGSYFDEYDRVGLDRIIDLVSSCEVNCHTECLIQSDAKDVSMWQQVDTWDGELCRLLDSGTGSFGYWALKDIQSNIGTDCSYEEYAISVCCAYIHDIIDYRADSMDGDKVNLVIQSTNRSDAAGLAECCGYIKAYIDDKVVADKDGVLIGKVCVLGFLAWNMTCLRYGALERIFQCALGDSRTYDNVTLLQAVKMEAQNICAVQDGDGAQEGIKDAATDWQEMISSRTQRAAHALVCERLYMWPDAEKKGMHKYCMSYFVTLGLTMLRNNLLELCCSKECFDFHEMDKEVARVTGAY